MSTAQHTIVRGENRRLQRTLRQADGTPLEVSALASAQVELIQSGELARTLTLDDPEVYPGAGGTSLVLELTSAITAALKPTQLVERWTLRVNDAAFIAEPNVAIHVLEVSQVVIR